MNRRALAVFVVVVLSLACLPPDAAACSCATSGPPCQAFWEADAVFVGRVTATAEMPTTALPTTWKPDDHFGLGVRVTFAVREVLAGDLDGATTIDVTTGRGDADCGYAFVVGRDYVVYASRKAGRALLYTHICTRTRPLEQGADDVSYGRQLPTAPRTGATITGTVRHVEHGPAVVDQPLSGVTVLLARGDWTTETRTRPDGSLTFRGLKPGTYYLGISRPDGFYGQVSPNPVTIRDVRGCAVVYAALSRYYRTPVQ